MTEPPNLHLSESADPARPDGWEPLFTLAEDWPADTPDLITLTHAAKYALQNPVYRELHRYCQLLAEAEALRQNSPTLAAIVECIEHRNPASLLRCLENTGEDMERAKRMYEEITSR